MIKKFFGIGVFSLFLALFGDGFSVFANPSEWTTGEIRLKYEYQHFFLENSENYIFEKKTLKEDVKNFCFEEKSEEKNQEILSSLEIDTDKIKKFLEENIAPEINQEVSHVRIFRNSLENIEENKNINTIQFEGYGYDGKTLDIEKSVELIAFALKNGISQVTLIVNTIPSQVTVEDEELRKMGIKEVISVGRSDFYPSSEKRIQNIMAGSARFNGFLVPSGSEFSFNTQLGLVDGTTGYAKEYVILGPKVVPEYGGGLCQVSSTAYRGIMIAGLEITERHNHTFAVNHYKPYGSDATIYQGVKDFRFKNDTENAILIQTRRGGKQNSELFFHYYGTKPQREVKIFGPIQTHYKNPLPPKTTYSDTLPEGTSQKVSNAVAGFNTVFERVVIEDRQKKFDDEFFSAYEPRGVWTIIGGTDPNISSEEIERTEVTDIVETWNE